MKILIIGAGLSGTLLAIRMAQRGFQVELREKRSDMRQEEVAAGRSINLALSNRGLKALDRAGMKEEILTTCIPMYGRMIHGVDGALRMSKYSGRAEEYINSVSRRGLNISLLNKAEGFENLQLLFASACVDVDLENARANFQNADGTTETVQADIVIGSDGVGSAVRQSMMRNTSKLLFNYSQDFLRSGYKELSIPPTADGGYRIEKNALHIWPRGKFMMIALPNLDGSFTVTMFHPYEGKSGFNTLDTDEKVQNFFQEYYADALPHLPTLLHDYRHNHVGVLGNIKCYPWQAYGKSLILGDAAHAIVPFYGQGMNASFEDVRVFDDLVEVHGTDWKLLFQTFQDARAHNTNAIADLAVDNFYEMQDKVADPLFIKKRSLEMQLEQTYPDYYSKYSLVTFKEELPYAQAMELGRKQDELLLAICKKDETQDLDSVIRQIAAISL